MRSCPDSSANVSFIYSKDHPSTVRNLVMAYHDHVHWGASDGMLLTLTEGVVGWRKVPHPSKASA
jgi:hypothetical protein